MNNRKIAWLCFVAAGVMIAGVGQAAPAANQSLQLPDFKTGQLVEFARKTTEHDATHGGPAVESGSTAKFDIEVVGVSASGALLRLTLTDAKFWGAPPPEPLVSWYSVFRGVPIEIETDRSGAPLKVVNWGAIRDRVNPYLSAQERIAGSATNAALVEAAILQSFLQFGPASDLFTLAAMQFRTPTALGHTDLPSGDLPDVHQARSIDVLSIDPRECRATINRAMIQTVTLGGQTRAPQVLATSAVVSLADGWTVHLTDSLSFTNYLKTTDIVRTDPAPCP